MKKILVVVITSAIAIPIGFIAGIIFDRAKERKTTDYDGTIKVYIPPDGERPLLFTERDVKVDKILFNKQGIFKVEKLENATKT